jgi:ParB-like chromosome segregation protein Spo0J
MVPVSKLRPNGFNPELRVNKKSQKYRNLRESVRQYGIIEPLIISPDGQRKAKIL